MIDRVCGIYLLCHTLDWSQIKFSAVRKRRRRQQERKKGEIEEQIGLCNSKIQDDDTLLLGELNYLVSLPSMHYENFTRLKPTLYIILRTEEHKNSLLSYSSSPSATVLLVSWILTAEEIHLQPSQSPLLQCHLGNVTLTQTILLVKFTLNFGAKNSNI